MSIALATLETNIYTTFYNLFTSGTYALTCISSSNQVTPKYSDNTAAKYGFPIIEINKPTVYEISPTRFNDTLKAKVNVLIVIAEDNSQDAKSSCDDVRNSLLNGKGYLKSLGISNIRLLDGDSNIINKNKKNYYFSRINVNFEYIERL